MPPAARAPLRLHPAITFAVIGLCVAAIIGIVSQVVPFAVAGQAYLLLAVLLGFRYWPPVIRWVAGMPGAHRIVFGLLVGGMIIGHFTLDSRKYFPFVAWAIFPVAREEDPVTARELIGVTASGRSVRLLAEQLVPSIVQIDSLNNAQRFPPATLEHLVHALAKLYNRHHADDPVRQVDLMVMAVKLHTSPHESRNAPSCELLKRYDISSGSN